MTHPILALQAPLVAALRSYWLAIHVTTAILGFGIFFVSGIASVPAGPTRYAPLNCSSSKTVISSTSPGDTR